MATPEELARRQQPGVYDATPSLQNAGRAVGDFFRVGQTTVGPTVRFGATPPKPGEVRSGLAVTPAPVAATPTTPPTTQRVAQAPAGAVSRVTEMSGLSAANQRVIEQDRANLQAAFPQPAGDVGQVAAPQAPQGPTYADKKGDYSMTGTSPDVIAAARRRADTGSGGVNFGFAPGGARAYLDSMAARDAQTAQRRQAIADDVERIGLRNTMERGSVQEAAAARRMLGGIDQRDLQRIQEAGDTARAGMGLAAELLRAQTTAGANLAAAQATAAGRLQAAQIEGQYGLEAAMAKQESGLTEEMLKQMSPQARKAALEASLLEQQMGLARQYDARGDYAARDRALGIAQPMAPKLIQDISDNVIGYQTAEGIVPIDQATAEALAKSGQYYLPPKG